MSLALALFACSAQAAFKFPPIDKAELADPKPHVDPEAGAEILLREIELDHSSPEESVDTHFVRVKIYNQRGVEDFTKIELPYDTETYVRNITARTIKPDGTIVELNSKEIYDREVIKTGNIRVKVKSFAPPGLEPGAIVEYRYVETQDGPGIYIPMFFQSDQPARKVRYKVKLLKLPSEVNRHIQVRALSFNCPDQPLKPDNNGWFIFEMNNLPAAKEEPYQPPAINILSSILVYYDIDNNAKTPKEYWAKYSKELHEKLESTAKPTKAIRTALEGIVAKGDSDQIKLRKIYDYCRTKIINRYSDASGLTSKQREKLKENETAADTLKAGSGTHNDINTLFAAFARAAGLDTHLVACNDRTRLLFNADLTQSDFMLPDLAVGIRTGNQWQYFDPGCIYLPFGVLSWDNTETAAIISDSTGKAEPTIIYGPDADASTMLRKGDFVLDTDGTLEGDVTETYTGYREVSLKNTLDAKTPLERETYIREDVQEYQKLAEVTKVVVENAAAPLEQLKITYHLRIPEYADKTGNRLFFQPAVFQKGAPTWFESTTRRSSLIFHYRFTTQDEIRIKPPENWALEEASSPGSYPMGELGEYTTSIGLSRKSGTIIYHRKFSLSGIAFANKFYQPIKAVFENIHKKDSHTLTLKEKESTNEPTAASIEPTPTTPVETNPAETIGTKKN